MSELRGASGGAKPSCIVPVVSGEVIRHHAHRQPHGLADEAPEQRPLRLRARLSPLRARLCRNAYVSLIEPSRNFFVGAFIWACLLIVGAPLPTPFQASNHRLLSYPDFGGNAMKLVTVLPLLTFTIQEGTQMRLALIAVVVLTGPASTIAVAQPMVVTPAGGLLDGLDPDPRAIACLKAPESPDQILLLQSRIPRGKSPGAFWLPGPVFGGAEAHVLRVETALASGIECATGRSGHYQGPEHILGCGLFGGCGSYRASGPTQFYWEDGCIDCTTNDPDNDCDGCSLDQACQHPPSGGADSSSGEGARLGGETP